MHSPKKSCLVRQLGAPRPQRLYCFSYAGGSAANYSHWQAKLDPSIEICAVELPGHGTRFNEAPAASMSILVESITIEILAQPHKEFAFFGHSLGALLAFEVARFLHLRGFPSPQHLFVSGASAPQTRRDVGKLHLLSDQELITALRDYNGTPPSVLEHEELMELLLPMIRADFALAANYVYRPIRLLKMPISVLIGTDDENNKLDYVDAWKRETLAECTFHWFKGDHFFIHPELEAVFECIRSQWVNVAVT